MPAARRSLPAMRALPLAAALGVLAAACGPEEQSYVPNASANTPTMSTTEVNTFISDSGYTRYFITSPLWNIYDEATQRYWNFPAGLELEQYDRQMRPTSHLRCDSARYFVDQRLWRLDGRVVMINTRRDTFLTQQVYWDQNRREVYSDSFIHISRADRVIEGYGFTSNEAMTQFAVNRPTGIFPAQRPGPDTAAAADTPAVRLRTPAPARQEPRLSAAPAGSPAQHQAAPAHRQQQNLRPVPRTSRTL